LIHIYQLELKGQPLISLKNLEASATLCKQDDPSQCWTTALTDNGAGFPDLIKNDGILSGIFVPSEIGKYNCWTTVSIASSDRTDPLHSDNSNAKSVDQNLYPCSCYLVEDEGNCVGAPVPSSVQMVADYPIALEVVNVDVNREVSFQTELDHNHDAKMMFFLNKVIFLLGRTHKNIRSESFSCRE
jgi:hypothetical protein